MAAVGAMHTVQTSITIPAFLRVHTSGLVPWLLMPLLDGRLCSSCLVGPREDVLSLPSSRQGWLALVPRKGSQDVLIVF